MPTKEQIDELNEILLDEMPRYRLQAEDFAPNKEDRRQLLRALMNVRPPNPVGEDFLQKQDALLQAESIECGIVDGGSLPPFADSGAGKQIVLWQGDITRLKVDAIVNAANSALLGCFIPLHKCIDNAIHSAAGVQLRLACAEIMRRQGYEEPTGRAKITPAFNLPSRFVLHTVGPIIHSRGLYDDDFAPTAADAMMLSRCYKSCIDLAAENNLVSVAFCSISTGEFHYPRREAAEIAVKTVLDELQKHPAMKVVFDVFTDEDMTIYGKVLREKL